MSWAEGFYWGRCKLECRSYSITDKGKTVRVTGKERVWNQTVGEDLVVVFTLPGTNKYTVSLIGDGETPIYTEDIVVGYGEYRMMNLGYPKLTFIDIQRILDSHKEKDVLEIGDELPLTLIGGIEMIYQIGGTDIYDEHDVLFVPKYLYPELKYMDDSLTYASPGFPSMSLFKWLQGSFYNSIPSEVRDLIVDTEQVCGKGTTSSNNITTTLKYSSKIILPTEYEAIGTTNKALRSEHTVSNSTQWPIFAAAANRIRKVGKTGNNTAYWLASPAENYNTTWCTITNTGEPGICYFSPTAAGRELGVLPCFRFKAKEE